MTSRFFHFRDNVLPLTQGIPLLAGILNCTPDSFSDGGQFLDVDQAFSHALVMHEQGADMIDIGGESTRPGSMSITATEEKERILPVIGVLRQRLPGVILSVDTTKAEVAYAALAAGADIVNDVSMLSDNRMTDVIKEFSAGYILMHAGGGGIESVSATLKKVLNHVILQTGLSAEHFMIDPGIGFGKSDNENFELLNHLECLDKIAPVYLGVSRKSFIGRLCNEENPCKRLPGTLAVAVACRSHCSCIRVHDVGEHHQALMVASAIECGGVDN